MPENGYHPEAVRLAETFQRNFWSSDREIRWIALEQEKSLWLSDDVVLVGKIDAQGFTGDGERFFGDWKTKSKRGARYIESEKSRWRMTPQALTYGVLMSDFCRRFTVRWALKTEPATTAFEWYTYETAEIEWWTQQLLNVADEIKHVRASSELITPTFANWETNLGSCTKYGEAYACPFRDEGCWKLKFDHVPEIMKPRGAGHLAIEARLRAEAGPDIVVLDATRVNDWLLCHEFYRRLWEGEGLTEENENLTIGSDFHEIAAANLNLIKLAQDAGELENGDII